MRRQARHRSPPFWHLVKGNSCSDRSGSERAALTRRALRPSAEIFWNLDDRAARRACRPSRRGPAGQGRAVRGPHRQAHRPQRQGQVHGQGRADRERRSGGTTATSRWTRRRSTGCKTISCSRSPTRSSSTSPTSTAVRSPSIGCGCASSTSSPGTICSSARCWSAPKPTSWRVSCPSSRSSTCRASAPIPSATAAAARR